MFNSPITSILGVLVIACQIIEHVWPEYKTICASISNDLIGLGLISAQDGLKLKQPAVKAMLIFVGLGFLAVGCADLTKIMGSYKNQIESVLGVTASGTYRVMITKDGQTLLIEEWTCTQGEDGKLTGCHKVDAINRSEIIPHGKPIDLFSHTTDHPLFTMPDQRTLWDQTDDPITVIPEHSDAHQRNLLVRVSRQIHAPPTN